MIYLLVGCINGVLSLLLYKRLSNQEKIKALKTETSAIRKKLLSFSNESEDDFKLIKENFRLSFSLLRLTLVPTIGSSIPVIGGYLLISSHFAQYSIPATAYAWVNTLNFWYFLGVVIGGLFSKFKYNIA